ncbi:MAG TPA: dihydroorotate dehydrogenase-like protein [Terriglobia bacterium]|jgi:dihydroorotate dehydrogenase (fumarate)|nr:dihydroorotate dehydrogenase-like protein [Terriglobia bacterium]
MADLATTYLGLKLKNPLVASASPLTEDLGNIKKMEDAGAAAVVFHSLFEEQINLESHELDRFLGAGTESFPESLTYLPELNWYNRGPDGYLEHLSQAKRAIRIPIIASLNGASPGGWTRYARKMEQAGADALELNIYFVAADPDMTSAEVERTYCELVREVTSTVKIPVAVKLSPYFSAMANMACRLDHAGAKGLVLFNRFYQPDFDLEKLEVTPRLTLSSSYELLLRLHWVAILHDKVEADLAVTGGVHTAEDVIKSMMAGGRVAMMTSALLSKGIEHVEAVLAEIVRWMEEHEYVSIAQMQGSMSMSSVGNPSAFERANYMRVLSDYAWRMPSMGVG